MKLSVIIPCYNAGRYLEDCVRSVLSQSMADFEMLLVDDGSKDDTLPLCRKLAAQDSRIVVFHQENAGVSAARNLGLSHAKGDWVLFVDADDLVLPHAFERMLSVARGDTDMVVALHEVFDEECGTGETVYPQTLWMNKRGERRRRAAALRLIEGDCVLNIMCNKLHRRAFIEENRLRLAQEVRIAEDALFNLEAVLCGREIVFLPEVTYAYRMHAQSATHQSGQSVLETHLPWLQAMREMLKKRALLRTYYPAFFESVTLRLYKDGGVKHVMRGFDDAKPLLTAVTPNMLSFRGRLLYTLAVWGLYPAVYPFIFPVQLMVRKLGEAAYALRVKREGHA